MFNTASDYAINKKNPHAIIYTDANGNSTVLKKEDFASEEDFRYWKRISDEDYRTLDIEEHKIAKRSVSLYELPPEYLVVESQESVCFGQISLQERAELVQLLLASLNDVVTPKQKKRIWMHYAENRTLAEIAARENVSILSVYESIQSAKKKLFIFLKKRP